MSMPALITTEPTMVSPYTIGTGVPLLLVFWIELNEYAFLGSFGESTPAGVTGTGDSSCDTPPSARLAPTPIRDE
jgi:hypothetical protein